MKSRKTTATSTQGSIDWLDDVEVKHFRSFTLDLGHCGFFFLIYMDIRINLCVP